MSNTVKIIIEIPVEKELIDKAIWYDVSDFDTEDLATILNALKNGTPLDDVKAEIKEKCDEINYIVSDLPYSKHREIQDLLCEILDRIIGKAESEE